MNALYNSAFEDAMYHELLQDSEIMFPSLSVTREQWKLVEEKQDGKAIQRHGLSWEQE